VLRGLSTTFGIVALLILAIFIAEIPSVRSLAVWIDAREPRLLIGVAIVIALGFALFLIGILKLLMDRGQQLTHAQAEDVARSVKFETRPVFARASRYRVRGVAVGRTGGDAFSLRDLKSAWRSGAVRRDPVWRRRAVTTIGALLLVAGIFGGFVVIGPPWIKVLFAGAFVFTFGRLGWGLARNR
jgi:hypothetical protein